MTEPVDRLRLPLARRPAAPDDAPNILLVLVDGTPCDSPWEAPSFVRLAAHGVSYTSFHVTALDSPSQTALLTGRSEAPPSGDAAPFPRILKENGYCTGAFGRWHLTPDGANGAPGPFDWWPSSWGFESFSGFVGRESGSEDLAEQAIGWLRATRAQDPERPWFAFLSAACEQPFETDAQIGAVLAALDELAELDDTLVIWLWGADRMVVHWPTQVRDAGGARSQFTHEVDIGPTILDIAGVPQPTHVDGVEQEWMHGMTFANSLLDADQLTGHAWPVKKTLFDLHAQRPLAVDRLSA